MNVSNIAIKASARVISGRPNLSKKVSQYSIESISSKEETSESSDSRPETISKPKKPLKPKKSTRYNPRAKHDDLIICNNSRKEKSILDDKDVVQFFDEYYMKLKLGVKDIDFKKSYKKFRCDKIHKMKEKNTVQKFYNIPDFNHNKKLNTAIKQLQKGQPPERGPKTIENNNSFENRYQKLLTSAKTTRLINNDINKNSRQASPSMNWTANKTNRNHNSEQYSPENQQQTPPYYNFGVNAVFAKHLEMFIARDRKFDYFREMDVRIIKKMFEISQLEKNKLQKLGEQINTFQETSKIFLSDFNKINTKTEDFGKDNDFEERLEITDYIEKNELYKQTKKLLNTVKDVKRQNLLAKGKSKSFFLENKQFPDKKKKRGNSCINFSNYIISKYDKNVQTDFDYKRKKKNKVNTNTNGKTSNEMSPEIKKKMKSKGISKYIYEVCQDDSKDPSFDETERITKQHKIYKNEKTMREIEKVSMKHSKKIGPLDNPLMKFSQNDDAISKFKKDSKNKYLITKSGKQEMEKNK